MTGCKRCPSPIVFVRMRSGKPMPVDPWPDTAGNIAALAAGPKRYLDGHYLSKGAQPAEGEVRLMPHWATCGNPPKPRKGTPRPTAADALF